MTRNASDCLLCHLTGLFGDQRQKEYDDWLLQEIDRRKGQAFPAVHFTALHSGLDINTAWKEQEQWESFSELRSVFDLLQLSVPDIMDGQFIKFLQWNQTLHDPFRIFAVLSVPLVIDASVSSTQAAYDRLRQLIEVVFTVCKFPVDGISFENADSLWKESTGSQRIEPRNHYLLRHIRSAMDQIDAQQILFVQSRGGFKDVNDYFSDGNNEVQLAGSAELISTLVKCLQEENSEPLVGITSQYRLNSLETAYFHTQTQVRDFNQEQMILACLPVLTCSGIPVLNVGADVIQHLEQLLALRMNHAALHVHGAQIQLGDHEKIWAIQRYSMDMSQSLLCLANFSGKEQQIILGDDDLAAGQVWQDLYTGQEFIAGQPWTIKPYQGLVLLEK